jgi:hypothetical protein
VREEGGGGRRMFAQVDESGSDNQPRAVAHLGGIGGTDHISSPERHDLPPNDPNIEHRIGPRFWVNHAAAGQY